MMIPQAFFIPLYFDEEEADLWQALQRIEPEKRSSFIKETLRQVLLSDNNIMSLRVTMDHEFKENQNESFGANPKNPDEDQEIDQEINHNEVDPLSLEALFSEVPVSAPKVSHPLSNGYQYMMKHIIGTEEDEEVLNFLQGSS